MKLDESFFLNFISMFIMGALIGTGMHIIIQYLIERYQWTSYTHLSLLGIMQLCTIAFLVKYLVKFTRISGFLLLGLLSSQDLVIISLYPKNKHQRVQDVLKLV